MEIGSVEEETQVGGVWAIAQAKVESGGHIKEHVVYDEGFTDQNASTQEGKNALTQKDKKLIDAKRHCVHARRQNRIDAQRQNASKAEAKNSSSNRCQALIIFRRLSRRS